MTMRRRQFLTLGLVSLIAARALIVLRGRNFNSDVLGFYVAGVRFNPIRGNPRNGERVLVRRERWANEVSYAVYTTGGERLGYLPRERVSEFDQNRYRNRWVLLQMSNHDVAWKRYLIGYVG
jgi:hypothetical protein